MPVTSKEIVILLLGIIGSALLAILTQSDKVNLADFSNINLTMIIAIFTGLTLTIIIFYKRMNELSKEIESIKIEQRKTEEKLKIYERLSKIEGNLFK